MAPSVHLVSAANATDAAALVATEFLLEQSMLTNEDECMEHLKLSVRILDSFYPHSYFPSKMGLVFHVPVELNDAVDYFNPLVSDGLSIYKLCVIQNTYVHDSNGEFSFTALLSECEPVMPALYFSQDYDSEPNQMVQFFDVATKIMKNVNARFGDNLDTIRDELLKANLGDVAAFMKEFVDSKSNYAPSISAQLLASYYHIDN